LHDGVAGVELVGEDGISLHQLLGETITQALQQKGAQTTAGTTGDGVSQDKTLQQQDLNGLSSRNKQYTEAHEPRVNRCHRPHDRSFRSILLQLFRLVRNLCTKDANQGGKVKILKSKLDGHTAGPVVTGAATSGRDENIFGIVQLTEFTGFDGGDDLNRNSKLRLEQQNGYNQESQINVLEARDR
jgi:hypothetical protein